MYAGVIVEYFLLFSWNLLENCRPGFGDGVVLDEWGWAGQGLNGAGPKLQASVVCVEARH